MIYHIVTGETAAAPLNEAIVMDPSMAGEVVVMKDTLNIGPLQKGEDQKFSELRAEYLQMVINNEKTPAVVDDMERLLDVALALSKDEEAVVWVWMAPWPADLCVYHWVLKYLGNYLGRFFVINIAGLPFLDENGKIFYPKNIGEILPKELVKARKLAQTGDRGWGNTHAGRRQAACNAQ
jgi:Domain of unknown function (DUF1835)